MGRGGEGDGSSTFTYLRWRIRREYSPHVVSLSVAAPNVWHTAFYTAHGCC